MVDYEDKLNFTLKEKIVKYLLENKNLKHSIREISLNIGADYKNVFNSLGEISDIVFREKVGNISLIEIKLIPDKIIFSVEEKRRESFLLGHKKLNLLIRDIESVGYPFFIVLVFGSYAKMSENNKSDIDICIISDNRRKTGELVSKFKLLPLNLEVYDFSFSEFESMLKTKEKNVSDEIIKKNVILYGLENYYNLISKWMKKE